MRVIFVLILLFFLCSCGTIQLNAGMEWQYDLLLIHKSNFENLIDVCFQEIERAYHGQVDERLAKLVVGMTEDGSRHLVLQAASQKRKITTILNQKKVDLIKDDALEMAVRLNRAMHVLTLVRADQACAFMQILREDKTEELKKYIKYVPDLNPLTDG